mgnify:CR=1 FL=1
MRIFRIIAALSIVVLSLILVYPSRFAIYEISSDMNNIKISSSDISILKEGDREIVFSAMKDNPSIEIAGIGDYSKIELELNNKYDRQKEYNIVCVASYNGTEYVENTMWTTPAEETSIDGVFTAEFAKYIPEGHGNVLIKFLNMDKGDIASLKDIVLYHRVLKFSRRAFLYGIFAFLFFYGVVFVIYKEFCEKRLNWIGKISWIILLINAFFWMIFIVSKGEVLEYCFVHDPYDTFMDFFNTVDMGKYVEDQYLQTKNNHPPMCHMIYHFLYSLIPQRFLPANDGFVLRENQFLMVPFTLLSISCMASICALIEKTLSRQPNIDKRDITYVKMSIIFSSPVLFTIERGNIIILSFVFALFFVVFYNSDDKLCREMSLLSLAFSASLKIYPAIYGIILLKDHKWKEAFRCAIYGLLMFVLPFFLYGGSDGFKLFLSNLIRNANFQLGYGYNFSLYNIIHALLALNGNVHIPHIYVLSLVFLCITQGSTLLLSKKTEEILLAATLLLLMLPKTSYAYSGIFLIIPFVEWLKTSYSWKVDHVPYIYQAFYIVQFSALPFGFIRSISFGTTFPTSGGYLLKYISLILICVYMMKDIVIYHLMFESLPLKQNKKRLCND